MASNEYLEKAQKFCRKTNTGIAIEFVKMDMECPWDKKNCHAKYKVVITRNASGITKRMTFSFWQSVVCTQKNVAPDEYDILACLEKYNPGTFEEFCNMYGYEMYDSDAWYNLESKLTYEEVRKEYMKTIRVFGDVIDDLREIY